MVTGGIDSQWLGTSSCGRSKVTTRHRTGASNILQQTLACNIFPFKPLYKANSNDKPLKGRQLRYQKQVIHCSDRFGHDMTSPDRMVRSLIYNLFFSDWLFAIFSKRYEVLYFGKWLVERYSRKQILDVQHSIIFRAKLAVFWVVAPCNLLEVSDVSEVLAHRYTELQRKRSLRAMQYISILVTDGLAGTLFLPESQKYLQKYLISPIHCPFNIFVVPFWIATWTN
jgi:hypothetical protein